MKITIRRQLRILQVYAAMSLALAAFVSVTAFTQQSSTQRIDELIVQRRNVVDANGTLNDANALPEGSQRDAAIKAARAKAPAGPRRVFVGKNTDKASTVFLADGQGRPRLVLRVNEDGAASIEFLDVNGKTTQRIPATQ